MSRMTSRPISTKTPSPAGTFVNSIAAESQARNDDRFESGDRETRQSIRGLG